jgi:hypothetical protein
MNKTKRVAKHKQRKQRKKVKAKLRQARKLSGIVATATTRR